MNRGTRNDLRTLLFALLGVAGAAIGCGDVLGKALVADAIERKKEGPMNVRNVFVLITTDKLFECRDFYVKHLGFTVAFQSTIYIQLSVPSEGGGSFGLALMPPDNPFGQGYREVYNPSDVFNGKGLFLTIEVADAAAVYGKLMAEGAPIVAALKSEDWGQRHFMTRDPGGTIVDVIESIEPAAGYYDRYQVSE